MMLSRFQSLGRRVPAPAQLWILLPVTAAAFLEVCLHLYYYHIPIPEHELDAPFFTSCQEPDLSAPRENAVLVMLARNSEIHQAKSTVESVERAFNHLYNYPILFLNDEPWDDEFVRQLNETSSGLATFDVVPNDQWTFPEWLDVESARQSIEDQGGLGGPYAGREGYHHMCRFFSGYVHASRCNSDRCHPNPAGPRIDQGVEQ